MRFIKYKEKYYNLNYVFSVNKNESEVSISFSNGNTISIQMTRQKFVDKLFDEVMKALSSNTSIDVDALIKTIREWYISISFI